MQRHFYIQTPDLIHPKDKTSKGRFANDFP
jgi:hypothetical protein